MPLALSVALLRAARAGIFIKNADAFERLRHVGTVLLDKTGTLTEGRATLARWVGDDRTRDLATALEAESAHHVARAFQIVTTRALRAVPQVRDVMEVSGRGIAGTVDGHAVRVGTRAHVLGAVEPPADLATAAEACVIDGLSPVWVSVDGEARGVAGIGDRLRDDAVRTVAALTARGLRVRILSGDHPSVVARVGAALGLPAGDVIGGLTPEAKRDAVAALVGRPEAGGAVVMVGDGVNDAAALALADVGIAVHGGTGASLVAADIVLTRDGVAPIVDILQGSRRLAGVIRRNIAFSLVYNLSASSLAVAGLVGPLLAAVLMPLSSLTVVLSSTLTRTFARPRRRAAAVPEA